MCVDYVRVGVAVSYVVKLRPVWLAQVGQCVVWLCWLFPVAIGGNRLKPMPTGRKAWVLVLLATRRINVFTVAALGGGGRLRFCVLVVVTWFVSSFTVVSLMHFLILAIRLVKCRRGWACSCTWLLSSAGEPRKAPWRTFFSWVKLVLRRLGTTSNIRARVLHPTPARKLMTPQSAFKVPLC